MLTLSNVTMSVITEDFDSFLFDLREEIDTFEVSTPEFIAEPELYDYMVPLKESCSEVWDTYRLPGDEYPFSDSSTFSTAFPVEVKAIRSFVGDDETITTNSLAYAVLCIVAGPLISKIKISWADVQFNRWMFNYAEGWILLPPTMDSGFESVTRHNRSTGVPIVLDPVRFKNLSAVRKQSNMEQDLPSKFRSLAETAAWTDRSWFTWDLHQYALILGVEIFDFMRSTMFPYLFQSEGGCGGAPPWNNLFTAAGAIFRYKRGRAYRGIIGIMTDADSVFTGLRSPQEALFTKNLNLALSGDKRWLEIRSEMERRKADAQLVGLPYDQSVVAAAEELIPRELLAVSSTVHPTDALTGSAIAFLRNKGYLMTEFDLVQKAADQKRTSAVWGKIPLREIEDQTNLRLKEYHESFLEALSDLHLVEKLDPQVYRELEGTPDPMAPGALAILEKYYRLRTQNIGLFSTFIFNERIRLFKTADVTKHYLKAVSSIRDAFCEGVESNFRPDWRRRQQLFDEEETFSEVEHWLNSAPLNELFQGSFPPGIGTDDARIAREMRLDTERHLRDGRTGGLYLVISSDKKMATACQQMLTHDYPDFNARIVEMAVPEYISWCLLENSNRPKAWGSSRSWLSQQRIQNPLHSGYVNIHGPLLDILEQESRFLPPFGRKEFGVYYDYPNVNRTFKRYRIQNGVAVEHTGGFLTRTRAEADWTISSKPLPSLYETDDFVFMKKKTIYQPGNRRLRVYIPKKGSFMTRSWRH